MSLMSTEEVMENLRRLKAEGRLFGDFVEGYLSHCEDPEDVARRMEEEGLECDEYKPNPKVSTGIQQMFAPDVLSRVFKDLDK